MKTELSGHYSIRRLAVSCIPTIGMVIITSIYSIVDGLFIANFAGTTEFAAMNIIWPAIALVSAIGLMIGTGGSALVSKTLGEGNKDKACSIFTQLIRIGILTGIVLAAVLFIFMKPIVQALGAEGVMISPAVTYGRIVVSAMPFFIMQMAFQSFYMTAERPELGTRMSLVCGLLNIGMDVLFIVIFGWGLAGAAIATAVAMAVGGIFPLYFFAGRRNTTHLKFVGINGWDWKSIIKSCTNGTSEYIGNVALNIVSMGYNIQLMRFVGEDGVSAYGIIMYVGYIFAAVFLGYNLFVSPVISFNWGAGNKAELRSLLRKSIAIIAAFSIAMTAISEIAAPWLSRIFVGYDDALCSLTEHAIRIYMLSYLLCGFNIFCSGWFTALNNGLVSAILAFARTLVFELASVFILPMIWGMDGIWYAVSVAEVLAFIMACSLTLAYRKRYCL